MCKGGRRGEGLPSNSPPPGYTYYNKSEKKKKKKKRIVLKLSPNGDNLLSKKFARMQFIVNYL